MSSIANLNLNIAERYSPKMANETTNYEEVVIDLESGDGAETGNGAIVCHDADGRWIHERKNRLALICTAAIFFVLTLSTVVAICVTSNDRKNVEPVINGGKSVTKQKIC